MIHIAADNPRAADAMDELFSSAAARLSEFPRLGKPGVVPGTRGLFPHENYRLVFEFAEADDTVWVLALAHHSRQHPPKR